MYLNRKATFDSNDKRWCACVYVRESARDTERVGGREGGRERERERERESE